MWVQCNSKLDCFMSLPMCTCWWWWRSFYFFLYSNNLQSMFYACFCSRCFLRSLNFTNTHTHTFIPRMSPCVLWGPFCLSFSTWNYALSVCSTVRLHACERNKIPRIAPGEQVGTRGGRARYTVQSPRRLGQATENKARPCRCTAADMVLMEKLLINMVEC